VTRLRCATARQVRDANHVRLEMQQAGITIIGGGLAGLTLGIGLRRRGVPVTVWEAGSYPRHRVCGEFISGRGQAVLQRLDLIESFFHAGAVFADDSIFFLGRERSALRRLPTPAICLSRFSLDALLARRFRDMGGELRENRRWEQSEFGEGVVRATGRRARGIESGWRWFGLKVHARDVPTEAGLEMHVSPHGYVGLTRLGGGWTNVCGLFRRAASARKTRQSWLEMLRGQTDTVLHERLHNAAFDESSACAVAGLSLRPGRASASHECRIGDAVTMIAPATGNGMSMAFEAAEQAAEPLSAYSRGAMSWDQARGRIAADCDLTFARRLRWSAWLHRLMFAPPWSAWVNKASLHSDWLWSAMFAGTR
jgi:menaquinone-9 beta-reductase